MNKDRTYRIVSFALAVVFAVFSVGVPIVVASCPMPKNETTGMCFECYDEAVPSTVQITFAWDRSCCKTVIAADPNTTEFTPTKATQLDLARFAVATITADVLPVSSLRSPVSISVAASPPLAQDILILTSQLLI